MFFQPAEDKLENYELKQLERICREGNEKSVGEYIVSKSAKNDMFTDFRHSSLTQSLSTGWKAHISIAPDQVSQAYKLIVPILVQYGVLQFKFSDIPFMAHCLSKVKDNENFLKSTRRLHDGMQVSIYMQNGQEEVFNKMLAEIENKLIDHQISPGIIDASDRQLGQFTSIRHQGTEKYLESKDVQSYNPEGVKDPFVEISQILSRHQPDQKI